MEFLVYLGPALLIASVPLAIAIYVLYLVWKIETYGPYIFAGLVGGTAYLVLSAIFPPDDFYIDELHYLTGIEVPSENIDVIAADSSYPDMQGDYYVRAEFRITDFDFALAARSAGLSLARPCGEREVSSKGAVCWSREPPDERNYELVFRPAINTLELTHMP